MEREMIKTLGFVVNDIICEVQAGQYSKFHDTLSYEDKIIINRVVFENFSILLIYGLIIYQVIVLYRKRKIAADITAEAAVES